ncbi:hypothetical protein KC968_01545 [Candidatus Saccharibacteria bacterium]|nr:hypothetical protein [Candidatus Saccharibacteria bacterium]
MEKLRKLPVRQKVELSFYAGVIATTLFNMGINVIRSNSEDRRVEAIQEHNAQIEQELSHDFPGMGRLVLNDETDTFEFHVSREQSSLNCVGEYAIDEDGEASVTEKVTCSETIALGRN